MEKSTMELLNLLQTSNNLNDFLVENEDAFISVSLADALNTLFDECDKKPAEIFRRASIEKSYGYAILSGKRMPDRSKLLALIFGLSLSPDEAQTLLKTTGYPPLYPKNTRDAVILFCLDKGIALSDLNETLYDMGLPLVG